MKKKLILLSLIISGSIYGEQGFFDDEKTVKLEETVISTTGFEDKAKNNLSSVTVITSEDIKKKNVKTVKEALQSQAGITINNGSPDLRGRGTERGRYNTKILVDGISINEMDQYNEVQIEMIPIDQIERIEVISGGSSVVYGDGASGGVINIITKSSLDKVGTTTQVGTETASHNSTRNFFNVTGGNEKVTAKLSYSDYSTDGYRENMDKEEKTISASLRYDFDKDHNITIKHTNYWNKYNGTYPLNDKEVAQDRKQGALLREFDIERKDFSFFYNNSLNDNLRFKLSFLDRETNNYTYGLGFHTRPSKRGEAHLPGGIDFDAKKTAISPKLLYQYGKANQLVFGYDYESDNSIQDAREDARNQIKTDFNKDSHSVFALNKYKLDKYEFTQGVRFEESDYDLKDTGMKKFDLSTDRDNIGYEIGLNYLYSETGNIYFRYEKGYVSPSIYQLIEVTRDGDFIANDKVESEIVDSFEIGFKDYIAGSYISANLFYSRTKDEIALNEERNQDMTVVYSYYDNLDKTERKGLEITAEQDYEKFKFSQNLSYIKATIESGKNAGKTIPGVSDIKATFGISYQMNENFDINGNITYQSDYYIDEANEKGKYNKKALIDLAANYIINPGIRIYGGVNNLFGEEYFDSIYNSSRGVSYMPASERYFYLGATYKF